MSTYPLRSEVSSRPYTTAQVVTRPFRRSLVASAGARDIRRRRNLDFLDFIGDAMSGTVVDIGPGMGRAAPEMRSRGARRLVAIEPNPVAAEHAADVYDEVVVAPIEDVDVGVFNPDLLMMGDTIEHLIDPWTVLRQLRDSVRPGTALAISTPNVQSIRVLWPVFRGSFTYSDEGGAMDREHCGGSPFGPCKPTWNQQVRHLRRWSPNLHAGKVGAI